MDNRKFDFVLEKERSLVLFAACVGGLGALFNIQIVFAIPTATSIDLFLQVLIAASLVALIAWMLLDSDSLLRGPTIVVAAIVAVGITVRLLISLFGPGMTHPPDEAIAPVTAYLPFAFVLAFTFLNRDTAIRVSIVFLAVSTPAVLLYTAFNLSWLLTSPRFSEMVHQFLFAHPMYIAFLMIISRVHTDYANTLSQTEGQSVDGAQASDTDLVTLLPNRQRFRADLAVALTEGRSQGTEICVGLLQLDGIDISESDIDAQGADEIVRLVATQLRQNFGREANIGRLSDNRFGIIWLGKTLQDAVRATERCTDSLNALLASAADPSPRSRAGLAAYRPGETLHGLLFRCDDELRNLRSRDDRTVSYDTIDL